MIRIDLLNEVTGIKIHAVTAALVNQFNDPNSLHVYDEIIQWQQIHPVVFSYATVMRSERQKGFFSAVWWW